MSICLTARSGRTQGPGQKANGHRTAGPRPDWPAQPEREGWRFSLDVLCNRAPFCGMANFTPVNSLETKLRTLLADRNTPLWSFYTPLAAAPLWIIVRHRSEER